MPDFLKNTNKNWTLFLDRDGVINERIYGSYVMSPERFRLLPGVLEGMVVFARTFGRIIVVTNQQGIGKGLMSTVELKKLHGYMMQQIKNAGGRVDAVYYCPDLTSKKENCRKPGTFMAMEAKKDFPEIDFYKSIMVGDTLSDMQFGKSSGMFNVLVGDGPVPDTLVHLKVSCLLELSQMIRKIHT